MHVFHSGSLKLQVEFEGHQNLSVTCIAGNMVYPLISILELLTIEA